MQGFRTPGSNQRLLSIHAVLYNHFNTRRNLIPANEQRALRVQAIKTWIEVVGVAVWVVRGWMPVFSLALNLWQGRPK
jgi:hypothetical protein